MANKVVQTALSEEQEAVLSTDEDLKVQAFAGCGKSTTLLHYIKRNPHKKVLYLSYSKPNTVAFSEKCSEYGLHAEVKTFHSYAKNAVFGKAIIDVEQKGTHSLTKLKEYLAEDLKGLPELQKNLFVTHAKNMISKYCNTTLKKLENFNYFDLLDPVILKRLEGRHNHIFGLARKLMLLMHEGRIPILHDYYLKLAHVKSSLFPFDTVLVDEVQDTTPCMLDMVSSQPSIRKIYVGDTHQDIYGWRGASRAMVNLPCKQLYLTESYRFGEEIADLANFVLNYKAALKTDKAVGYVAGKGPNTSIKNEAIIARTLSGILQKAIEINEVKLAGKVGFLGGLSHYTYHEQGGSLRDVYSLYLGKRPYDPFVASFDSFEPFKRNAIETEDYAYIGFIDVVETYRKELGQLLFRMEKRFVDASEANLILTTSHKAKGCEFEHIMLCNDFKDIPKLLSAPSTRRLQDSTINEEINILYTALTRASMTVKFDKSKSK
jgi:F-box protein 18 (helicase)